VQVQPPDAYKQKEASSGKINGEASSSNRKVVRKLDILIGKQERRLQRLSSANCHGWAKLKLRYM